MSKAVFPTTFLKLAWIGRILPSLPLLRRFGPTYIIGRPSVSSSIIVNCRSLINWLNSRQTTLHLSNNHWVMLINSLHVYWFLRFFPPFTPHIVQLCTSFFPINTTPNVYWFCNLCTPSMFIPTSTAIRDESTQRFLNTPV